MAFYCHYTNGKGELAMEQKTLPSRSSRRATKSKNRLDRVLNYLIAMVCVLIVISAFIIFNDSEKAVPVQEIVKDNERTEQVASDKVKSPEIVSKQQQISSTVDVDKEQSTELVDAPKQLIEKPSNDAIVDRIVIDPNWQPTTTTQTGPHLSSYDENSADWHEKIATLLSTAGLSKEEVIIWSVQNNGGPQSAIGVISTKDRKEKYRISMEWVDNVGWKPVQMEVLKTLEGAY